MGAASASGSAPSAAANTRRRFGASRPRAGRAVRNAVPSLCDSHLSQPAVDPACKQLDLRATCH